MWWWGGIGGLPNRVETLTHAHDIASGTPLTGLRRSRQQGVAVDALLGRGCSPGGTNTEPLAPGCRRRSCALVPVECLCGLPQAILPLSGGGLEGVRAAVGVAGIAPMGGGQLSGGRSVMRASFGVQRAAALRARCPVGLGRVSGPAGLRLFSGCQQANTNHKQKAVLAAVYCMAAWSGF